MTVSKVVLSSTIIDLLITHNPTGDTVTVQRHFTTLSNRERYKIDQILFMEDGTVWTADYLDQLLAKNLDTDNYKQYVRTTKEEGWIFGKPYYVYDTRWRNRNVSLLGNMAQLVANQGGAE